MFLSYVDDASLVAEQQVPEEAGLAHLSQVDHVVHALHQRRVHDPEGGLQLLGQAVLLEWVGPGFSSCWICHKGVLVLALRHVYLPLIVHQ